MKQLVSVIYTILSSLINFFKYLIALLTKLIHMDKGNEGLNKPNSRERPYEELPRQLSNRELLAIDHRDPNPNNWIFPQGTIVDDRGRLINPTQFIVAGKGPDIDKLTIHDEFWLGSSTLKVNVRVIKSRKSAPHGKRYVLLEVITPALDIATAQATELNTVQVELNTVLNGEEVHIFTGPAETQNIGVLHPSGSNSGGGQSHSGQNNAYGVAQLVRMKPARQRDLALEFSEVAPFATFERDAELGIATIAVLDSGILFENAPPRSTLCSDIGWDFVADDSVPDGDPYPDDNHLGLHGTKICSIIKHTAPGVGILPVKVSNINGKLTLYDALCGLEYARTHGAKIVNASWSFTADGDNQGKEDFPLLLQAIRDLEESGVVVVAAAGNKSQYVRPDGHIGENDAPKIYPACYSAIQDNVITVTTIVAPIGRNRQYTVFENYSNKFVDTGAIANAAAPEPIGQFIIPGFTGSYDGTSFATPYVAAKIAQVIYTTPGYTGKRTLLHRLREFHIESGLADKIRDGGSYIKI